MVCSYNGMVQHTENKWSLYINQELFTNIRLNEKASTCLSPIAGYHLSKVMKRETILSEWILSTTAVGIVSTKFTIVITSGKTQKGIKEGYSGVFNYICKMYFLKTKMYVSEAVEKQESHTLLVRVTLL